MQKISSFIWCFQSEKVSGAQRNNSTRTDLYAKNFPKHLHQMSHYPVGSKELYQISFDAFVRKNYGAETSKLDFSRCYRAVRPRRSRFLTTDN